MGKLVSKILAIAVLLVLGSACSKEKIKEHTFEGCYICYGEINQNIMVAYTDSNGHIINSYRDTIITGIENMDVCISLLSQNNYELNYEDSSYYLTTGISLHQDNTFSRTDGNPVNILSGNFIQEYDSLFFVHNTHYGISTRITRTLHCNKK